MPAVETPKLVLIAALTGDRVIGRDGALPWDLPEEYAHFLDCIRDQTVIIGRKSWDIFGHDLTSRHHVVVSRTHARYEGSVYASSVPQALALAARYGKTMFCAGGGSLYDAMIGYADTLWLSHVHNQFDGDTYFPRIDEGVWHEASREPHEGWDFVIWERRERRHQ